MIIIFTLKKLLFISFEGSSLIQKETHIQIKKLERFNIEKYQHY